MPKQSIFIPASKVKVYGDDIRTLMGRSRQLGDIGIEIECEGNQFYKGESRLEPWWHYHEDHSLRGQDNAEYVLQRPIAFDEVPEALKHLWEIFKKDKTVLDESNRTSVHIHLNVQKWCVNRLASFTAMFFAFEEILSHWAGDHRVGNLFCLRAKDAPFIATAVKDFVQTDGGFHLSDHLHYAGLNLQAMAKFGSLENRFLRGATDPQLILDWVAINRRLYEYSENFPDPREVCNAFSYGGPLFFFKTMLGDTADIVRAGINWTDSQIADSLYEGIRIAQDICFCRDWSLFVPKVTEEDPFGRIKKKSIASILQAESSDQPVLSAINPLNISQAFEAFYNMNGSNLSNQVVINDSADLAIPMPEVVYDEPEPENSDDW
jgi:hypothetical protein